ncbi:MAG: helix-turn-helix domain-containing protein [Butyrivibrio sp.]|nr:helix-turn-helix domain-containing protein [Butyrivibrio sp.]
MRKEEIGKLIKYERNRKGIDAKALSRGICSDSIINRLESGKRIPDFFMLTRIITGK